MLGYMEQQPLYNAANFSWAVVMGTGWAINTTVSNSIVSTFLCPSDNLAPSPVPAGDQWSGRLNNYFASVGTTLAYQGGETRHHGGLHPGGQSLRRPEHHRRDLQYDRLRRSRGRPGCRRLSNQECRTSSSGMAPISAVTGRVRTISPTPTRTLKWSWPICKTCQLAALTLTGGGRGKINEDDKGARWAAGRRWLHPDQHDRAAELDPVFLCLLQFHGFTVATTGLTRTSTACTPAAPTSCSPTAACASSSRRSPSTTYWALGTKANGEVISSDSSENPRRHSRGRHAARAACFSRSYHPRERGSGKRNHHPARTEPRTPGDQRNRSENRSASLITTRSRTGRPASGPTSGEPFQVTARSSESPKSSSQSARA